MLGSAILRSAKEIFWVVPRNDPYPIEYTYHWSYEALRIQRDYQYNPKVDNWGDIYRTSCLFIWTTSASEIRATSTVTFGPWKIRFRSQLRVTYRGAILVSKKHPPQHSKGFDVSEHADVLTKPNESGGGEVWASCRFKGFASTTGRAIASMK